MPRNGRNKAKKTKLERIFHPTLSTSSLPTMLSVTAWHASRRPDSFFSHRTSFPRRHHQNCVAVFPPSGQCQQSALRPLFLFRPFQSIRFHCKDSEEEKVENDTSYSLLSQRPIPAALPEGEKGKEIRSSSPEKGTKDQRLATHCRASLALCYSSFLPSHFTFLVSLSYLSLSSQSDAMNVLVYHLSVCNFHESLPIPLASPHQREMRERHSDVKLLFFLHRPHVALSFVSLPSLRCREGRASQFVFGCLAAIVANQSTCLGDEGDVAALHL